jgi:hypothetical protein
MFQAKLLTYNEVSCVIITVSFPVNNLNLLVPNFSEKFHHKFQAK